MNYSFLIELYHVLTVPLSKATRNEPIGSKTENCRDVIEFYAFAKFSTFPITSLGFPWTSTFRDPKNTEPRDVPIAKLMPFGLNTADVSSSY